MSNTFGEIFRLTTFGESHGPALGGIIDGCPPGILIDENFIAQQMTRRKPGQSEITTQRKEEDKVKFLSGILNSKTTGAPIGFIIENTNARSQDYDNIQRAFRPSHADYTYHIKYNGFNDVRGGGRTSARETVSRIVGGAIAQTVLHEIYPKLSIHAYTRAIGNVSLDIPVADIDFSLTETNDVRCPDSDTAARMKAIILDVKNEGDTIGGIVECVIKNCPVGIGQPVFDKLNARLASAMMSINAAKGFEIGMGFSGATKRGSETIDIWHSNNIDERRISALTNFSGGIQGGLSNGEDIVFRTAFKPVATLLQSIPTVDYDGNEVSLKMKGRHDPCVVPRAVPIVESMAAMVLLDLILLARANKI